MRSKLFVPQHAVGELRVTPPGIFNPAAMAMELKESPVRIDDKPGGSDVGHMVHIDGEKVIVKAGISLSLLGQAAEKFVAGKEDKAEMYLGFIVGNFTRITFTIPTVPESADEETTQATKAVIDRLLAEKKEFESSYKKAMFNAFKVYLASEEGLQFLEQLRNKHQFTTDDVYRIARAMIASNDALKDIIALPTFADIISGAHSQLFNNVFQLTQSLNVAKHAICVTPDALLQASYYLPDAKPFDAFLLESFRSQPAEGQTEAEWMAQCQADLRERLKTVSLKGLCSNILIRLIMGENADNGPDNMVLGATGVINVDLTGFRYPREKDNKEFKTLGWAETLKLEDADALLARLFESTVFKNRFITDDPIIEKLNKADGFKIPKLNADKSNQAEVDAAKAEEKKLKTEFYRYCGAIQTAVVAELKNAVSHLVVGEVIALKEWAVNMDAELVNFSMKRSIETLHAKLSPAMQFSKAHLNTLYAFNSQFITQLVTVAKDAQYEMEFVAEASMQ